MFHSTNAMYRVQAVLLVIAVLAMVAFIGSGTPSSITGFQLYHEGNECATLLEKYDVTCASPLSDIVAVCQTSKALEMCGTQQGCMNIAIEPCK